MADLNEKIGVELDNIEQVLAELPDASEIYHLSILEVAGVAALLHSFYNGIENIIKQIVLSEGGSIPTGESWHKELMVKAAASGVISEQTKMAIAPYMAFRHFFSHAYALDLVPGRIEPLAANAREILMSFRQDIGFPSIET